MRERETKKKVNVFKNFIVLVLLALIGFGAWYVYNSNGLSDYSFLKFKANPFIPVDKTATIGSIGDTLVHSQNFKDAADSSEGPYDFSSFFKNITHYFKECTVSICNQETPMAGADRGYSGYPMFNTPDHLATDLKEMGIDICTTATNHTLDKGFAGLSHNLDVLDEAGIQHTGSARTQEERDTILFYDLNGIKTAILAYTYGTNGIPVPSGKGYCVNLIDKELIKSDIAKAKSEGAELLVCCMHWGIEYQTKHNNEQEKLAEFLVENDVQVIIGCHPHVLQELETKTVKMDDGTEKTGYVIYSMGNFFSAQTDVNTRNSAIFMIHVRKSGVTGEVSVDGITYKPIYCYDNGTGVADRYEILDLEGIVKSYEAGESKYSATMYNFAKTEIARIEKTIGPEINNKDI